jgi:hypothetical protein
MHLAASIGVSSSPGAYRITANSLTRGEVGRPSEDGLLHDGGLLLGGALAQQTRTWAIYLCLPLTICDRRKMGELDMKYAVFLVWLSGVTSSDAGTLTPKLRMAQESREQCTDRCDSGYDACIRRCPTIIGEAGLPIARLSYQHADWPPLSGPGGMLL